jgi:low affinity Fe/Cu permease
VLDPQSSTEPYFDLAIESYFSIKLASLNEEGGEIMKLCFCRFLLTVAVVVLAIFWWPAMWAKWVIVAAAAILAIMSLFYQTCCCRSMKKAEAGAEKT